MGPDDLPWMGSIQRFAFADWAQTPSSLTQPPLREVPVVAGFRRPRSPALAGCGSEQAIHLEADQARTAGPREPAAEQNDRRAAVLSWTSAFSPFDSTRPHASRRLEANRRTRRNRPRAKAREEVARPR